MDRNKHQELAKELSQIAAKYNVAFVTAKQSKRCNGKIPLVKATRSHCFVIIDHL